MHLKRALTTMVGGLCECSLLRSRVRKSALRSFNVVYYHFVGDPAPHYQSFYGGCTLQRFSDDLARLNRVFDFAPLNEVLNDAGGKRPLLALTFDDGFDLWREGIVDVLDRYKVRATSFVITSCIGNQKLMWRHLLSTLRNIVPPPKLLSAYATFARRVGVTPIREPNELMSATTQWDMRSKDDWARALWEECDILPIDQYLAEKRPYFDCNDLRKWIDAGHSVGFHTHTHPFCSRLTADDLPTELIKPAQYLKQTLGIQDLYLSYPFGDRLPPRLERQLFDTGIFRAFFGIRGFQRKSVTRDKLERAGVEDRDLGWSVFATHVLDTFRPDTRTEAVGHS